MLQLSLWSGNSPLWLRSKIALNRSQLVILEEDGHSLLGALRAAGLHAVDIVPAVAVKGILQQGRAHNILHLATGHARAQLVHHILGDDSALLDVDFVGTREANKPGAAVC